MSDVKPVVLDYSTPRVFFEGVYHMRTGRTLLVAAMLLAAAAFFFSTGQPTARLSAVAALLCLLLSVWCGAVWLAGPRRPVRITEDGITVGDKFWDWRDVTHLGGILSHAGRVEMFFEARAVLSRESLSTTPLLRLPDYVRLMRDVHSHVSEFHPHVHVETLDESTLR